MVEREPRRAIGVEELVWGEVMEAGHGTGGDGSYRHGGGQSIQNWSPAEPQSKWGGGQLERGCEGEDASMRN